MYKIDKTQAYKDEIKAWLESDEKDFYTGYELFVRFAHNRALALFLARKQKLSKLEYELGKICTRNFIKEAPGMPIRPIMKVVRISEDKKTGLHQINKIVNESSKLKIVQNNRVNYDDLPDELKQLYDESSEKYKRMRAVHEKMKLAKTDDAREQCRSSIVYLDDKITENWKVIDTWADNLTQDSEIQKAKETIELTKKINAARSYLSRNVNGFEKLEGVKREKMFDKLKLRFDTLKKHNASIKKATRDELFKIGLITDWRDVQ